MTAALAEQAESNGNRVAVAVGNGRIVCRVGNCFLSVPRALAKGDEAKYTRGMRMRKERVYG